LLLTAPVVFAVSLGKFYKLPNGNMMTAKLIVNANDMAASPETAQLYSGEAKIVEDGTRKGDNVMILETLESTPRRIAVSPQDQAPSPTQKSGGAFEVCTKDECPPLEKKTERPKILDCLDEPDNEIPDLPTGPAPGTAPPVSAPPYTHIADYADDSDRLDLVRGTQQIVQNYEDHASEDLRTLSDAYRNLPPERRRDALDRAAEELRRQNRVFDQADRSSMLPGERLRFRNNLSNALDKAEAARKGGTLESLPSMQALASGAKPSGVTPDALTDRMVLLNALSPEERARMLKQLHLVETPTLTGKNGKAEKITVPHNGYWLGGSRTGTDCSGLASQSLPAEVRKLRFTTLDFRTLYQLARTGRYLPPPKYDSDRLATLKELSHDFEAVQPHLGEDLKPFDLLVYRIGSEPIGHVFIVENYDRKTLEAQVLEASQSHGGLRSRHFNLSMDPRNDPHRTVRPGLFALRLKKEAIARKCSLARNQSPLKKGSGS
jgi:hypothetical protein